MYLVASLCLANQNEGIGANDGQAEVDQDDRTLRADVPRVKIESGHQWMVNISGRQMVLYRLHLYCAS